MKDDYRKQIQEKCVTALVTRLTSRLPDVGKFSVLDPSKLPQESEEGYTTNGNNQLDLFCSRYDNGVKHHRGFTFRMGSPQIATFSEIP